MPAGFKRLFFPLVTLFWVTMNVLLWRSEIGSARQAGSPVPTPVVWDKMLTAPDDSSLQIVYQGRNIGYCRWAPNVGEELATGKTGTEDYELEGRVKKLSGYTVDVDGSVLVGKPPQRLRFNCHANFDTNRFWRQMTVRLTMRPNVLEIRADASAQTLAVRLDSQNSSVWQRTFTFAEMARPESLLGAFGGPLALGWLADAAKDAGPAAPKQLALGLNWQARNDWLKIGHAEARVYRLEARLLDKYQAVLVLSRVGEILRVELPSDLVLVNEALSNF
jgi:hypothetical protein